MPAPSAPKSVMPNFRTPRLFGIFNVLFAAQILVCSLCMSGYVLSLPLLGKITQQAQKQVEAQSAASRKAALEALDRQEKSAKTAEEKVEIAARRKEVESRPKILAMGTMDINQMGFSDPQFIAWCWSDVVSSLVLNVMLLSSGVGLLHWRPWARSLAIWTAALKVLRLVLVYGFFIIAIVPTVSKKLGETVSEMMRMQGQPQQMGGKPISEFFAWIYAMMYSSMGLGAIVFGVIYPLLLLWYLNRPGVKLACSGTMKLPKEPAQPW